MQGVNGSFYVEKTNTLKKLNYMRPDENIRFDLVQKFYLSLAWLWILLVWRHLKEISGKYKIELFHIEKKLKCLTFSESCLTFLKNILSSQGIQKIHVLLSPPSECWPGKYWSSSQRNPDVFFFQST